MPYIDPERRSEAWQGGAATVGELCYVVTRMCQEYLNEAGRSFATYGEVRNALASAWDVHFLPQLLVYEAKKRADNGDV